VIQSCKNRCQVCVLLLFTGNATRTTPNLHCLLSFAAACLARTSSSSSSSVCIQDGSVMLQACVFGWPLPIGMDAWATAVAPAAFHNENGFQLLVPALCEERRTLIHPCNIQMHNCKTLCEVVWDSAIKSNSIARCIN